MDIGDVYDGSISYIDIIDNGLDGATVRMVGNSEYEGKGATWATFKSEFVSIEEFSFKYTINKGDSFNSGGFMFNVTETPTTLEGYMLSINFAGQFSSLAGGKNGAIYKFVYNKGDIIKVPANNQKNVEKLELVIPLNFGTYTGGRESSGQGNISIKVTEKGYKIHGTELSQDYDIEVRYSTTRYIWLLFRPLLT